MFEPNPRSLEAYGLGVLESIMQVNNQRKVFVPVVNYHQKDVYMDEGTVLGSVDVYPDGVSGLTQNLELADCNSSVESGTLEAGVAVVSADGVSQSEALLEAVQWPGNIAPQEHGQLKALLTEYRDVFALADDKLGCTSVVQQSIDIGDHAPIKQYPRRTPFVQRAQIAKLVAGMERKGVISPSVSPWASPVVLVAKKDGSTRFCVNFRRLNAITKKDVHPLPRIEDILDTLGRAQYFSTLDLSAGFWQIPLNPADKEKTAFTTHCGLFEFNRMPFGLCHAPATFNA